jgi:UDP-N-acetylmuramate dehydrogenase
MSAAPRLDDFNTLGVAATADRVVVVEDERALQALLREPAVERGELVVLGGGSNVVLKRHVPGTVAVVRTRGIRMEPGRGERANVSVAAGESWHGLVRFTVAQGLSGLENLALIPGSVGAAPLQNIGAYGVELADRLISLRVVEVATGAIKEFHRDECGFSYRDSRFKSADAGRFIILDVMLALSREVQPVIDYPELKLELQRLGCSRVSPPLIAEAVVRVRRRKLPDPRRVGNVGSFFKNPVVSASAAESLRPKVPGLVEHPQPDGRVKLSAAQLIDRAGFKARTGGKVGVWPRQALVLVNRGGASGADFLAFGQSIRAEIRQRYDVSLELEAQVYGVD